VIEIAETLAHIALRRKTAGDHSLRLAAFATAQRTRLTELPTPFQRAEFEPVIRQARQLCPPPTPARLGGGEAMSVQRAFAFAEQLISEMAACPQ